MTPEWGHATPQKLWPQANAQLEGWPEFRGSGHLDERRFSMATLIAEDGVGLYAESHGDGIPVILSNGLCTTCENFRPQVEAFVDAGAQLILWDYRGHGRSESPDDPAAYTLDRVLSDLGRVLDWAAPGRRADKKPLDSGSGQRRCHQ